MFLLLHKQYNKSNKNIATQQYFLFYLVVFCSIICVDNKKPPERVVFMIYGSASGAIKQALIAHAKAVKDKV